MRALTIKYEDPRKLRARPNNPRTHTPRQIKQIAASIQEFGFINPVLIDGSHGIVAGHARVAAAVSLGMTDVPTVRVDHLNPTQIRAYVIADNRLAEKAGWDPTLLALELQELSVELNLDVTVTGFEMAEIDLVVGEASDDKPDEADVIPEIDRSFPLYRGLVTAGKLGIISLVAEMLLSRRPTSASSTASEPNSFSPTLLIMCASQGMFPD